MFDVDDKYRDKARARLDARLERNGEPRRYSDGGVSVSKILIAVVVVVVVCFAVRLCTGCSSEVVGSDVGVTNAQELPVEDKMEKGVAEKPEDELEDESEAEPAPLDETDFEKLLSVVDEETAKQIMVNAESNPDVYWMVDNFDAYVEVDEDSLKRLFTFAANEPEAVVFAKEFLEYFPAETGNVSDAALIQNGVPLLYQWDQRWGYTVYSSAAFGFAGCCPTSLAMVYQALTGECDLSPYDMGELAKESGYMTESEGTDARFLLAQAPLLGLTCEEIPATADNIAWLLSDGALVIANVGPGDFTEGGHFIVLAGLAEDGSVIVNDPYSAVRSAKTWDAGLIAEQSKSLFAFRLA